jgi:uncharacterized protein CbrC (UPF0167 family)
MEDLERDAEVYCTICKTQIKYLPDGGVGAKKLSIDMTDHKEWCTPVGKSIERRFKSTFRDIYNVLELSIDDNKIDKVKELIGDEIYKTQCDCINFIANYFLTIDKK